MRICSDYTTVLAMDLLITVVTLVFVLLSIGAVNSFVVFGSEIRCEAANNGSCVSVLSQQDCEHVGKSKLQCFGADSPSPKTNCPTLEDEPVRNCPNYYSEDRSTQSQPIGMSVDAYVVSISKYGLHVSWTSSDDAATDPDLQGYQVRLFNVRNGTTDRESVAGCACKNRNETEHSFILSYNKLDNRQLTISVTSYPVDHDVYVRPLEKSFDVPGNCYDSRFSYDPSLCGAPRYDEPTDVKMVSTRTSNNTMSALITWEPPMFDVDNTYPRPTTYYLYLNHGTELIFVVNNTEAVTFHSLSINTTYFLRIRAYVECSGYSNPKFDGWNGCGIASHWTDVPYPVLASSSSLMISDLRGTPVPTTAGPGLTTNRPRTFQWDKKKILAVTGGAVGGIVLAVLIGIVLIRKLRQNSYSRVEDIPDPDNSEIQDIGEGSTDTSGYILKAQPFPVPRTDVVESPACHSIFLLYSPHSPEVERNVILARIWCRLRDYVDVTIPEQHIKTDGSKAQWLSNRMMNASLVLCVCNTTFKEEWAGTSLRPPSVEVSTLKELVSGRLVREGGLSCKFATVCLKQSARKFIPAILSGTSSFLMADIESIVSFTTETPRVRIP